MVAWILAEAATATLAALRITTATLAASRSRASLLIRETLAAWRGSAAPLPLRLHALPPLLVHNRVGPCLRAPPLLSPASLLDCNA